MAHFWNKFIFGTRGDDLLQGTDNREWLFGLAGNDTVEAGSGNDRAFGGRGDDLFIGGAGNDRLHGDLGFDTAVYAGGIADYRISWPGNGHGHGNGQGHGRGNEHGIGHGLWSNIAVTSLGPVDDAGTDRLWSVEALYFQADDYTFYLDGQNNAVLAGDDVLSTGEDTALTVDAAILLANDREFDGDTITLVAVGATAMAGTTVTLSGGQVTYDPGTAFDHLAAGEIGCDSFTYTVDDGQGGTDTATVTVKVTGVNDAPVVSAPGAVTIDENTTDIPAAIGASDVDSAALSFSLSGTDAALFEIDATTGALAFVNAPDYEMPADADGDNVYDVTLTVSDGTDSDSAEIAVTVADVAEGPFRLTQSFEPETPGGSYTAADTDGNVLPVGTVVDLVNNAGGTVDSTQASIDAGLLGFDATWVNTRADVGLSDGDFVGVTGFTGTVGAFTDGVQGYEIQDADGLMRLTFDAVDLSGAGATEVSIDHFLQETGWEADDLLRIYVLTDTGTIDIVDSTGADIDDLGIEGAWITGSAQVGAAATSAQLVVELDSNSSSESLYIDNIRVTEQIAGAATLDIAATDAVTAEGDSGTTQHTFTVTRSGDLAGTAAVDWAVSGDADAADFGGTLPSGTVNFAAGADSATITIDISGDIDPEAHEGYTVTLSNATGASIGTGSADGTILDDDTITLISAIQGAGDMSPFDGLGVTVNAVVTYIGAGGFFLQEEDADADGNAATSEGIFVFAGGLSLPGLGDRVSVSGTVDEFNGLTEITNVTDITVELGGQPMPTAAEILLNPAVSQDFEAVEGMRISLDSGVAGERITVIQNFNLDRFGEIHVSAGNQVQGTQIHDAQTEAAQVAAVTEGNFNNRLLIDDAVNGSNPTEFAYIPVEPAFDNGNGYLDAGDSFTAAGPTLRLGAEIAGPTTGVMSYGFGEYRMFVDGQLNIDQSTNTGARQATPDTVGGDLQLGAFNVLNYFTTLGDRGATTAGDLVRQTDATVDAMLSSGVEIFALQEIENNGFGAGSAIQTLTDALNAAAGAGSGFAVVDPSGGAPVGTDAITTGIVYDSSQVTLMASDFLVFDEPSAAATFALAEVLHPFVPASDRIDDFQRSRPAVAATFMDNDSGETFTVVSVHFKSKGDSNLQDLAEAAQAYLDGGGTGITQADIDALTNDPNYDSGNGQGFWNGVRLDAAQELQDWLGNGYQGGVSNFVILGDYNSYAQEDPVQELRDTAGYTDLIDQFIGQENAYSFVFDGQRGTLDQAIASDDFALNVTGLTEWHINADEPDLLNYSSQFNDPAFYNADPFASSDHDPLIMGLDFGGAMPLV